MCCTCARSVPAPAWRWRSSARYYGVARFASDLLRVNDEQVLGLTGAQYLCLAMLPASAWIWFRVRKQLAGDIEAGMPVGVYPAEPEIAEADLP